MTNFKVGETVVCTTDKVWIGQDSGEEKHFPKKDDEVTIIKIMPNGYLQFAECPMLGYYDPRYFEKKSPTLSMTFLSKADLKEEREKLILVN